MNQAGAARTDTYRSLFLPLWVCMVMLQSGLLIHDVSAAWLISGQTQTSSIVALAQTASTLPFFLLALPAGALADLISRGRIIRTVAFALSALSLGTAAAAATGTASIALLLSASFLNGCGNALFTPAWQALTPEIVTTQRLPGALALNSLGMNIARSIGPVVAGLILFASGPAAAFLFNAGLYALVGLVFLARTPARAPRSRERLGAAMAGGIAYMRHDPQLQRIAVKATAFFFFASTFWALAPVIVHAFFAGTSLMLGLLVGMVGLGAVLAALLLKRLRARFDIDQLMLQAGLGGALALALVPAAPNLAVAAGLYAALGFCWLISFSSIHLAAQFRLTPWIRARGTSFYLIAVFGSVALGSALSGVVADAFGPTTAYLAAAAGLGLATLAVAPLKITRAAPLPLAPSRILHPCGTQARPLSLIIRYRPHPTAWPAAADALAALRNVRLRTGARDWSATRTASELQERLTFDDSTALAQAAERQTAEDAQLEARLLDLLLAPPILDVTSGADAHLDGK